MNVWTVIKRADGWKNWNLIKSTNLSSHESFPRYFYIFIYSLLIAINRFSISTQLSSLMPQWEWRQWEHWELLGRQHMKCIIDVLLLFRPKAFEWMDAVGEVLIWVALHKFKVTCKRFTHRTYVHHHEFISCRCSDSKITSRTSWAINCNKLLVLWHKKIADSN